MYKPLLISILGFLLLFISSDSLEAQRSRQRSTRTRVVEEDPNVGSRLGISIGTLGFANGWSISAKGSYGYSLNKTVMVGGNAKFFFDTFSQPGPDPKAFSYGAGGFLRLHITDEIYAQGEYSRISLESAFAGGTSARADYNYPSVGGGYARGYGKWTYGFHLMVPIHDEVSDAFTAEYWIDFNYKF